MTSYPFTLPGHENLALTYQTDGMGTVKIFCDGKPMNQKGTKFKTTLASGEEIVLGLKYTIDIFNPKVTYNKQVISAVPSLPRTQMILIYLPLALVTVGGAIGGAIGALGAGINHAIFRGSLSAPLKVTLSIFVALAAFALYAIGAGLAHRAIN